MRPRGSSTEQHYNGQRENPNPTQNEQNSTDNKKKNRGTHRASVSAQTNALGLVSIILIIGMIATIFFAVSYSGKQQFKYFSPRKYLSNFSSTEVDMPASWHQLLFLEEKPFGGLFSTYVRAYFEYNGIYYHSKNRYLAGTSNVYDKVYEFEIGGTKYYSELVQVGEYNGEALYANLIHLPAISYNLFEVPDISVVGSAWQQVEGFDGTLVNAFVTTGKFLVGAISFEVRIIDRVIPWNSVEDGNREWLDNVWASKEEELGFSN